MDHEIGFRLLQQLISQLSSGEYTVPAVVTTTNNSRSWWPAVQDLCVQAGIPLLEYELTPKLDEFLRNVDWILLLSWRYIIPSELLNVPAQGILNLHYSYLPSYRGVYPVNWAIMNGEHSTGFTFHFVTEEIDAGKIFMQRQVPIYLSDTARTLQLRIDDCVYEHFGTFLQQLMKYDSFPTGDNLGNNLSPIQSKYYSRTLFDSACRLDLEKRATVAELINYLRGMSFLVDSPNAYVVDPRTGKKIYININLREES